MDDPSHARAPQGTLSQAEAVDHLARGDALLASGDLQDALGLYQRVIGYADPAITAAGLLGTGNVWFRASREDQAMASWRAAAAVGETPSAYSAWRSIAAQLVRDGQLPEAIKAYREADRRAPSGDRAEIASRLGWLAKETGNSGAASRYFARSRGGGVAFSITYAIIAITVVAYIVAPPDNSPDSIFGRLLLDKSLVAQGEYWRLFTVALLHESPIHLAFNMYALYLVGPVVERIYGWKLYIVLYLACDLAASVASFVFGDPLVASVGASGAIFGLFGCLFIAGRLHNPILDRQSRGLAAQIGTLIVLNLAIGFTFGAGTIDNFAHVGGLLAGGWLGFVVVPRGVPTLASGWVRTSGLPLPSDPRAGTSLRVLAVVALLVLCVVGVIVGSDPSRFAGLG
ncbi:MAG TPA: rhomboid family intramembrane serine protease [Candidatus Limnocylindrales bacterium]|jgi:membrane associated rhomboid family serine protease